VILKHIERQVDKSAILFELKLNIEASYFIDKIENNLKNKNLKNQTNVKADMTNWCVFNNDTNLIKTITNGLTELSENFVFKKLGVENSWGIKKSYGDKTIRHNHRGSEYSGVLYLSDESPPVIFPEMKIVIKPRSGTLILFDGFLDHLSPPNQSNDIKYAIAFNLEHI